MLRLFLLLSVQQTQPTQPALPASPVARLVVTPANPVINAGDTLRLSAQALDADGKPVPNAVVRFRAAGGGFEAEVDSLGLVASGATGSVPVAVVATVSGARPKVEMVTVRMVAGPAARVVPSLNEVRLATGQRFRLDARIYSRTGDERTGERVTWTSAEPNVARVDADGMVVAGNAPGRTTVTARAGDASVRVSVEVVAQRVSSLTLEPARIDARQGDVITFRPVARGPQGAEIRGLSTSWSFSPGQGMIDQRGAFVGYEPGEYLVTATLGGRSATALVRLADRDVRRPMEVVGRLPRMRFRTEELWIHPDGKHAYLGSGRGGDVMYAIDISNPAKPVVTDSIVANTRRVNDIMTTPDGKFLVFTREGAADRKNGIVIASTADPAHPKAVSEFTDGVTAGVHSAFVNTQPK
ncbi:MAG: Ig-like domain-containing protein, partial [Gemmatimonadaceae bacterium]